MSSHPDCIFEIHQLWQSGFRQVYSNSCCSCWFEAEMIKIGQSSHKMYSNNILNFQESMTILNGCTKKSGNLLNAPRILNLMTLSFWWIHKQRVHSFNVFTPSTCSLLHAYNSEIAKKKKKKKRSRHFEKAADTRIYSWANNKLLFNIVHGGAPIKTCF